ncbi:MAG: phosphatidylglycerol lysyltransferase domain-containing protein [Candidatus Omnitrophota bacterium]
MQIPSFLTSEQCLACRGCCLFHDAHGDWSPRLMPEDVAALLPHAGDAAWQEGSDQIRLKGCAGGAHACSFLNVQDHHCSVYAHRPFECRLYPFLLSREAHGFKVYAHLSCPAIAALKKAGTWGAAVAAIREYFQKVEVQALVERGAASYPDYSLSTDEVEEVFAFDPAARLWAMRPYMERALSARPGILSSRSFVNMLAWKDFFDFSYEEFDGCACVFAAQPAGIFMYWPPLGVLTRGAVDAGFGHMRAHNHGGSLTRVENVAAHELPYFDQARYRFEQRGQEYVYARRDIAGLCGKSYKSRRGDVNIFERSGAHVFRPYEDRDFNACAGLYDRWAQGRDRTHADEAYRFMLEDNRIVHRVILSYASRLGLVGRVVEVNGLIEAYTFGYALSADTFCVLLEVADVLRKGLPAFVFSRFCRDKALEEFTWINAMDDMSTGGLARAKMLWRPTRLEPLYAVMLKE